MHKCMCMYIYDIYVYKCNFVVSYKQVEAFVNKFLDLSIKKRINVIYKVCLNVPRI